MLRQNKIYLNGSWHSQDKALKNRTQIRKDVEECYMHYIEMDKQADKITLDEKKTPKYSGQLLNILKTDINVLKQYKSKIDNPQSDNET